MDQQRIIELIAKYRDGHASPSERQDLLEWYRTVANKDAIFPETEDLIEERMLHRLHSEIFHKPKKRYSVNRWMVAAAVLFVVGSICLLFRPSPSKLVNLAQNTPVAHAPSNSYNKAILTVGGGKKIILNEAKNGVLVKEPNVSVTKAADGRIVYQVKAADPKANDAEAVVYNTLTTPRGGEYQVVLPDGSQVWLNAASSITYPSAFTGKERLVRLTGEAYFEVAKNPKMPFKVNVNGVQEVEVLGTHFNINGYEDEHHINTTLLEGSVKLTYKEKQVILKPGQTGFNDLDKIFMVKKADIQEVMAWRNGMFVFHEENIVDVMKVMSRWYDVDVEFRGDVRGKQFGGDISKYKDITAFLEVLKLSGGINYKIEGRRVIIMD